MHGDTTGLEPTDSGSSNDPLQRERQALSIFNAAAKAACDVGEWKLQREAEDAAARCVARLQAGQVGEGLGSGQTVHGQDPQAAQVDAFPL